ncbi:hypothetical protein GE061_005517 [Apolygus lucorum]|uniref:Uncharacterized protein n=1 Tax=Apolygus lucorum TaxID=248454 RepID=A0A8S9WVW4_APOLU|nr:hypothetical protein GE061_005517 [Apolygus lucorum]
MALNPTDIGQKEIDAIGLTDHKPEDFRLPAKHIPGLKELVKKDLDETIALVQELENATSSINNGDSDVVSQVAKLQKESADTSDKVHKLYKQLKTLLALHTTNRTSCMNKQVEALTLNASELAACSSESEDEVLKNIFHEATIHQLTLIKEDLEKELAAVTLECHKKEKKLAKYAANEEQLLSLAATLEKLNEEIDLRTLAINKLQIIIYAERLKRRKI